MKHRDVTLNDKYVLTEGQAFMTGIQALVRLPLDQRRADQAAGLNTAGFISGYRGSPLGGYDQQLRRSQKLLDAHQVVVREGLNEDLGATAVWGSQMVGATPGATVDGVFGIWYGKAPGVDRTGDVFKHANFAGTSRAGGVLALAGDDANCKSSTLPSQSDFAFMDAEIPVLNPANVQEVLDYGRYGLEMSRFCGAWIGMIALADTMDGGAVVDVSANRFAIARPDDVLLPPDGLHLRADDMPMEKERRMRLYKLPAAQAFVRANRLDRVVLAPPAGKRARVGVMATGQAARDVFEALDAIGLSLAEAADLGLTIYKVAMPWPLEPEGARAFADGLERILVVEHKRALIEPQLMSALYHAPAGRRPVVLGKRDADGRPFLSEVASLTVPAIARAIHDLLPDGPHRVRARAYFDRLDAARRATEELANAQKRAPHYCSGCPHNTSTIQLPEGSRALAGIGCHYMATWIAPHTDFFSQMGGEGVSWIGQQPFTSEPHVFVNLGDGTYSHSGSLAIRASVAAKSNITYKILYNSAVAMTGGQDVDMDEASVPQIAAQVTAENVARCVVVTDDMERIYPGALPAGVKIYPRAELVAVEEMLRDTKGVTVLIYDQMCATERRRKRKRGTLPPAPKKIFINPAVCEGCGDCSAKSNCLSVEPLETEFGRKRQINQSSCNQDYSCVNGFCPSFVSVYGAGEDEDAGPRKITIDGASIPTPEPAALGETWNILFTGVGGTGVTTVSAILGMAAHIDERASSTLDMTGLAQKGGAVLCHLRLARETEAIRSGRIPPASADVVIACDLVVATGAEALDLVSSSRTHAVVNTDVAPTAEFIFNRDARYEAKVMDSALGRASKSSSAIDAERLSVELLGDAIYANMLMAGFAWQKGLIPISTRAIYRAIKLNGVAVEDNQTAFDLGRLAAHDPAAVAALAPRRAPAGPSPLDTLSLDEIINHREHHLRGYQDAKYATQYRSLVDRVRVKEIELGLGEDFTRAVAIFYAKLMAYKDEYEVARLYTDGRFEAALKAQFKGKHTLKFNLAPPLFSEKDERTGHLKKREFGPWMFPAFKMMAKLKGLRGTAFDVFGRTEERRMERRLRDDYAQTIERLLARLGPKTHALAVQIAHVPDQIRGFGHVKEASVKTAEAYEAQLWRTFETLDRPADDRRAA